MSNSSNNELSATIANMMEMLNPGRNRRRTELRTPFDFMSPIKRRLSTDSVDNPEKRQKLQKAETSTSDESWVVSPWESRRIRAEVIEARSTIATLESRIQHMHDIRKELQIMFDNEIKSYQQQHERDKKSIEELEQQLQSVRKREEDIKEELEKFQLKEEKNKFDNANKIEELELKISRLESDLKLSSSDENTEVSHLNNRIEELQLVLEAAKEDAQAQKEFANELQAQVSKLTAMQRDYDIKEQELLKAQLKVKDLEYKLASYGEWQAQSKIQQFRLSNYPVLEKEVHKLCTEVKNLKDEVKNKLLLEEQVHDLQTRMEKYREQEKSFVSLQSAHNHLENLVEEWRLIARGISEINVSDAHLPKTVRQYVDKLQQQELSLTTKKFEYESQLKQSQHEAKQAKSELERSTKQITELITAQQEHQSLVHRLQKKLKLVGRERDSYRLQLDAYEKDLTINVPANAQNSAQIATHKERIENLEKIIEGYQEMISNLENELMKYQPQLNAETVTPVRSEQLSRLQEKIERLQNENNRLTERCDELEVRLENEFIGKDHVKGQIFHLKLNPLAESVQERENLVEKLQAEVDRLKRKIRNMEEGIENSKLSESICSSKEVQSLREQVKSAEIKMQRLKECFKTSSNEFRNACYMLFGYKIDRLSTAQYSVSSMYADDPDDRLLFQLNQEGNINLLENAYSSSLEDLVELHLSHQNSIPVFLSALTMELFNRTTMNT